MGTLSRTSGAVSSRIHRSTVMADEEAKQKEALNATLKEYIAEWRKTREKKEEEEKLKQEEAEKKAIEAEEKKKKLEETEAKRQEMLDAQKAGGGGKKSTAGGDGATDAHKEMSKTKEQLEEEKKIALSIRIKPLDLAAMDSDELKAKAEELFNIVIALETDKYDYKKKKKKKKKK